MVRGVSIAPHDIPVIKNKSLLSWVNIFYACHNQGLSGLTQWCWPDGKSYFDQFAFLPQIFNLIKQQIAIYLNQQSRKKSKIK